MQAAAFFEYPEFWLAALLSLVVLVLGVGQETESHSPGWLAKPARTFLLLFPEKYLARTNRLLIQAGWRNNLIFGDFASVKLYLPFLSLFLLFVLPLYVVLAIVLVLWFIPDVVLAVCVTRRQNEIRKALPQALDLMILCVDAGVGLDSAVQKVSSGDSGITSALSDELNTLGREIFLGVDREKAYQDLYNRTGVDELKTIGSALGQANKLGLSIARILRSQSDFVRKKLSQKAEEKAMKMPIYMAFPLWFLIMPSLMLLVLGPSLIKFYHAMNGSFPH